MVYSSIPLFFSLAVLLLGQVKTAPSIDVHHRSFQRGSLSTKAASSKAILAKKRSKSYAARDAQSFWWTWSSTNGYKLHRPISQPEKTEPSTTPTTPPTTKPVTQPAASSDVQSWLDNHNKYRVKYGAPNVQWSETLVTAAKRLSDSCVWKHTSNNEFGENMSAGQSSIEEVVDGWVNGPNEKESYSPQSQNYSHFTQVVWVATTEIGCAMTSCDNVQGSGLPQSPVPFWVCEYNPPGNVIGEFDANVKAAAGGAPAV